MLHAEKHRCLSLLQHLERVHNSLYLLLQISDLYFLTELNCVLGLHLHLFD